MVFKTEYQRREQKTVFRQVEYPFPVVKYTNVFIFISATTSNFYANQDELQQMPRWRSVVVRRKIHDSVTWLYIGQAHIKQLVGYTYISMI